MKTLFVAWKDARNPRGWFPVGRLDADVAARVYSFRYIKGARQAANHGGFAPFDSFPSFEREYLSGELFPFFMNRVQNPSRPSFHDYLERLDLEPDREIAYDPIELLGVSEGRRATDNLEVFPKVERSENSPFAIKFFLHGLRYLPAHSMFDILKLRAGQELSVALEANNPATGWAIQLQSHQRIIIGYAPRYLLEDLIHVILHCEIVATVARVNPPPAPPGQRLMALLEGCWPEGYQPMSGQQFQPLVESKAPMGLSETVVAK